MFVVRCISQWWDSAKKLLQFNLFFAFRWKKVRKTYKDKILELPHCVYLISFIYVQFFCMVFTFYYIFSASFPILFSASTDYMTTSLINPGASGTFSFFNSFKNLTEINKDWFVFQPNIQEFFGLLTKWVFSSFQFFLKLT